MAGLFLLQVAGKAEQLVGLNYKNFEMNARQVVRLMVEARNSKLQKMNKK